VYVYFSRLQCSIHHVRPQADSHHEDDAHPSPLFEMKLSIDYIGDAIDHFEPCRFFFSATVSTEGEIWKELDTQIVDHFASLGITLPQPPQARDSATLRFQHLPWVLLNSGNRTHDGYFSLKRASITGVDFNLNDLKSLGNKLGNPRHNGQLMFNLGECHCSHSS